MTEVQKAIQEFGKDNIFLIKEDYKGRYEDDYSTLLYFNNVTKEFFEDGWTTATACPDYSNYKDCFTIGDAIERDIIDKKFLLEYAKEKATLKDTTQRIISELTNEGIASLGFRVKVERGRKWKGVGYCIGKKTSRYQYATPMFKVRGGGNYGVSTTTYLKIFDPMTNKIEYININNVDVIGEEEFKQKYIESYNRKVENCRFSDITWSLREGIRLKIDFPSFIDWLKGEVVCPDTSMAFDEEEYNEKKKASEFRTKKMTDLIEWVKNNTDKQGDDILKLAEHIYNKKYA